MMNKTILLLLIVSSMLFAGEEEGTGTPSSNATSNATVYQLVCTPVADQESSQNCIVVEVQTNN